MQREIVRAIRRVPRHREILLGVAAHTRHGAVLTFAGYVHRLLNRLRTKYNRVAMRTTRSAMCILILMRR